MKILETVQKRAVNMVTGLSNDLFYSEKLKLLGLQSLEVLGVKLDQDNKISVNPNSWFNWVHDVSERTTRISSRLNKSNHKPEQN